MKTTEDAFMSDLFAGLDSSTFDDAPSSPLASTSQQPKARPRLPPKPTPTARALPKPKPAAHPPRPPPFWDAPKPTLPSTPKLLSTPVSKRPASVLKVRRDADPLGGLLDGIPVKLRRHVEIAVGGKENEDVRARLVDLKGKGRAVEEVEDEKPKTSAGAMGQADVDALLEGLDWDEPMLSQEEPVRKLVVRCLSLETCERELTSARAQIPHSKQFTRCRVTKVVEDYSSHKATKVRSSPLESV